MKATGIVRRIDDLGRVVIPIELRRSKGVKHVKTLQEMINDNMNYEPKVTKKA